MSTRRSEREAIAAWNRRAETANARLIVDAVNERDRLRDLVRRFADGVSNYRFAAGPETNALLREARAVVEEGRRLSAKPFGRPATEQEVDARFPGVEWCMYCTTDCPLSHHDALCVCDHYNAPDKKGVKK